MEWGHGKAEEGEGIKAAATIEFQFKDNPDWANQYSVFICHTWRGEPKESEEMRPPWYRKDAIPFKEMWIDDSHWLPLVLAGKKITGKFLFENDGKAIIDFTIAEVHP